MFCTKCGHNVPDNSKFCTKCGNKIAVSAEAIMAAEKAEEKHESPAAKPAGEIFQGYFGNVGNFTDTEEMASHAYSGNSYQTPENNRYNNQYTSGKSKAQENNNNYAQVNSNEFRLPDDFGDDFGDKTVRVKTPGIGRAQSNPYAGANGNYNFVPFDNAGSESSKEDFFPVDPLPVKKKKKSGGKAVLKVLVAIVLVIAAGVGGFFAWQYTKINSAEAFARSYNMNEKTIDVARDGKNIFYVNSNGHIVKSEADGTEREIIVDDAEVDIIFIRDKKLYYHNVSDDYVYSCSFSGGSKEKVILNKVHWFTLTGDTLYYVDGYTEFDESTSEYENIGEFNLYSCDMNGENIKKIINVHISSVIIADDFIVYLSEDGSTLYKTDINGDEEKTFFEAEEGITIEAFKEFGGVVYVVLTDEEAEETAIWSLSNDTKKKLTNAADGAFTFHDNRIIYNEAEGEGIFSCTLEGVNPECVLSDYTMVSPKVYGDYLYFSSADKNVGETVEYSFGEKNAKVVENDKCGSVVFIDDQIFYIDSVDSNIYKCDMDGKNTVQLTDGECYSLFAHNDEIYYYGYAKGCTADSPLCSKGFDTLGLYRLDPQGAKCSVVELDCINGFAFSDTDVYFNDGATENIYITALDNIDDEAQNKVFMSGSIYGNYGIPHFVYDGYLYATSYKADKTLLSRINLETAEVTDIFVGEIYNIKLSDKKLYFTTADESGATVLLQTGLDGTNPTVVAMGEITDFAIFERTVYYADPVTGFVNSLAVGEMKPEKLNECASSSIVIHGNRIYYSDNYNNGYLCSMNLDGSDNKVVIGALGESETITERFGYRTDGIN